MIAIPIIIKSRVFATTPHYRFLGVFLVYFITVGGRHAE